jgi:hypothetical protein
MDVTARFCLFCHSRHIKQYNKREIFSEADRPSGSADVSK